MADKSPRLDVIPISLLKNINTAVSPFIATLANISLQTETFTMSFKSKQIAPILKKVGLPTNEPGSYRLISSIPTIWKILERLVLSRLMRHVFASPNIDTRQPAYMQHHSPETYSSCWECMRTCTRFMIPGRRHY